MKINTRHFGEIEIEDEKIVDFPEGIPGFEHVRKFVLLSNIDEDSPFRWLQCVDDPSLAFAVIDPRTIKPDYTVDVDDSEIEILNIENCDDVVILSIVVVPEDITRMTANLKAPIIINSANMTGKQVIMDKCDYPVRYFIFEALECAGGV